MEAIIRPPHGGRTKRRLRASLVEAGNRAVQGRRACQPIEALEARVLLTSVPIGGSSYISNSLSYDVPFHAVNAKPAVACNAAGDSVVVWQVEQTYNGSYHIHGRIDAQRYDAAGRVVGNTIVVNSSIGGPAVQPVVAMDSAGDFVVAWTGTDYTAGEGYNYGVLVTEIKSNGDSLTQYVNTITRYNEDHPAVAMDPAGDFVVTWQQYYNGLGYDICMRQFGSDGLPRGDHQHFVNGEFYDYDQTLPTVAMDSSGNFSIAWESYPYGSQTAGLGIYAKRYDSSGGVVKSDFQVNGTNLSGDNVGPAIAMDNAGDFIVAWESVYFYTYAGNTYAADDVVGRRFNSTGTATTSTLNFATGSGIFNVKAFNAAVAMDANGDYQVAFQVFDGSYRGSPYIQTEIGTQAFTAAGDIEGNASVSGVTDETSEFRNPAIAMDARGDALIVWQSASYYYPNVGQDAFMFARRYSAPVAGTVSGTIFNDLNGNGVQDAGEPGDGGIAAFADLNGNGIFDPSEPFADSDSLGHYMLNGVDPGSDHIAVSFDPNAFFETSPAAGYISVNMSKDGKISGKNFGVVPHVQNIGGQLLVWGSKLADSIDVEGAASNSGTLILTYDGTEYSYAATSISSILINALDGADFVTLEGNATKPTTVNAGTGADSILLGFPTGGATPVLDYLTGPMFISGQGQRASLVLNDNGRASAVTYALNSTTFSRTGMGDITYNLLSFIGLNAGNAAATYNIDAVASGMPVTINGGSGSVINIGQAAQNLENVHSSVNLNVSGTLTLFDQNDAAAGDTYTITSTKIQRNRMAAVFLGGGMSLATTLNAGNLAGTIHVKSVGSGSTLLINADDGNDSVLTDSTVGHAVTVNGGSGADSITGGTGNDVLTGGLGNDTITGNGGNDTITGGDDSDSLSGGTGNDKYIFADPPAAETDTIREASGAGTDLLDFSSSTVAVTVNLNSTTAALGSQGTRTLKVPNGLAANLENVNGGSNNDSITGNGNPNVLNGNGGKDTLTAIFGASGGDNLNGGAGNDLFFADNNETDSITGGSGIDTAHVDLPGTAAPDNVSADTENKVG